MQQGQNVCVRLCSKDCWDWIAPAPLFLGAIFFKSLIPCCSLTLCHHLLGGGEHLPKAIWKIKSPKGPFGQPCTDQGSNIPATLSTQCSNTCKFWKMNCLSGSRKDLGPSLRDMELRAKSGLSTWGLSLHVLVAGSRSWDPSSDPSQELKEMEPEKGI